LEHLLFAAYLVLFSWLVTKNHFFKNSGLSPAQLIIIFLLKVIAGIFYGWIGVYYGNLAQMVDTWMFHFQGLKGYELLLSNPHEFFTSLFRNNYQEYGRFLSNENSWWNDLHNNSFIMIISFFNLLSFGNYYINVIFFSFLTIYGPIAIYRVMGDVFPSKKQIVLFTTFLLPSFIYWTSGIHKDGLVFVAFALVIYNFYFGLKNKDFSFKIYLMIDLGLLLILTLRNYFLIIILPALAAWLMAEKFGKKPVIVFSSLYLLFAIAFFSLKYISPQLNFPQSVVNKQQSFIKLKGGSPVAVTELKPTVGSFLNNLPEAISLSLVRPYPSDVKHLLSLAASTEINILLFCFILLLLFRKNGNPSRPFLLFCLFFSFTALLTIGYTVTFLGAIVRYRSIVLPFLVIPMMALIDWKKIEFFITRKH
jgi:hypothetical protein